MDVRFPLDLMCSLCMVFMGSQDSCQDSQVASYPQHSLKPSNNTICEPKSPSRKSSPGFIWLSLLSPLLRCSQITGVGPVLSDVFTNQLENVPLEYSEDCLYLNIYSPADLTSKGKLPVSSQWTSVPWGFSILDFPVQFRGVRDADSTEPGLWLSLPREHLFLYFSFPRWC